MSAPCTGAAGEQQDTTPTQRNSDRPHAASCAALPPPPPPYPDDHQTSKGKRKKNEVWKLAEEGIGNAGATGTSRTRLPTGIETNTTAQIKIDTPREREGAGDFSKRTVLREQVPRSGSSLRQGQGASFTAFFCFCLLERVRWWRGGPSGRPRDCSSLRTRFAFQRRTDTP